MGVGAAEPEGGDGDPADAVPPGGQRPVGAGGGRVEAAVADGVDGVDQVGLRGCLAPGETGERLAHRDHAGGPTGVADHRLVGGQQRGAAVPGDLPESGQFGAVPRPGAGGVGDDPADVRRVDPGGPVGTAQGEGLPGGVGRVDGPAPPVPGQAQPLDDAEDPVPVRPRPGEAFQHHHPGTVGEQHPVGGAVEAADGARAGQPLELGEQHEVTRGVGEGTTAHGQVDLARAQCLHPEVQGVEGGGAGGVDHEHFGVVWQDPGDGVPADAVGQELVRWLTEPVVAAPERLDDRVRGPGAEPVEVPGQHQVRLEVLAAVGGVAEGGEAAVRHPPAHPVQGGVQAVPQPERRGLPRLVRAVREFGGQSGVGAEVGDEAGTRRVGPVLGGGVVGVEGLDVEEHRPTEHVPPVGQHGPQSLRVVGPGGHDAATDHGDPRVVVGAGPGGGGTRDTPRPGWWCSERGVHPGGRVMPGRLGRRRGRGERFRAEDGGAEGEPSVGDDGLPGDPGGGGRGQEDHQFCQFLLPAQPPAQRGGGADAVGEPARVGEQAGHGAVEQASRGGVDADAVRGELHGQVAGQRFDGGLRGTHRRVVPDHLGGADRGQVHDGTAAATRDQRRGPVRTPQGAPQVGVHRPLPVRVVQLVQG